MVREEVCSFLILNALFCLDYYHVIAFWRCMEGETSLVFVCNFTPWPREEYQLGLLETGSYREVLNNDASVYGGSDVGNGGWVEVEEIACDTRSYFSRLRMPPLGVLIIESLGA